MESKTRQQTIDFDRGSQLALLNNLRFNLPVVVDGKEIPTSEHAMIAVLRVVDDCCSREHRFWRLKKETIGNRSGLSKATVKRAIRALVAIGVLIEIPCKEGGWHASAFGVCWSNLKDFDKRNDQPTIGTSPEAATPVSAAVGRNTRADAACGLSDSSPEVFFAPRPRGHGDTTERSPCTDREVMMTRPRGHDDPSYLSSSSNENSKRFVSSQVDRVEGGKISFDEVEKHGVSASVGDANRDVPEVNFGNIRKQGPSTSGGDARHLQRLIANRLRLRLEDRNASDVSLVTKVAVLCSQGAISECDVHEALEAVRRNRPENPRSYFHVCLNARLGGELNRMLASLGRI